MSASLEGIFSQEPIAGVFESIKPGFPTALPAGFYTVSKSEPAANGLFTYDKVEGTRKTARAVRYNAKSSVRNVSGVDTVPVKAMFSAEHLDFDLARLINIRQLGGNNVEAIAMSEINRRLGEARQLQQNLRNAAVHLSLMDGILYFDIDGNVLPTSASSTYSIDWSVPASNKDQMTDVAGSPIIGTTWATNSTDIAGDVNNIKTTALKRTGYPLKYAVYGSNILEYIQSNTNLANQINGDAIMAHGLNESGELPSPFLGLTWIRGDQFFWEDNDGTTRSNVGADQVLYYPEPDPSWYDFVETPYLFTEQEGLVDISAVSSRFGPSIQTKVTSDPVAASGIYRDAFLPVINVPSAIYLSDVTP